MLRPMTTTLALALALCAWVAPGAHAQTAVQAATRATNNYDGGLIDLNNAYNAAKSAGVRSAIQTAYLDLQSAWANAYEAEYYYSIGNYNFGDEAAADAIEYGDQAANDIHSITVNYPNMSTTVAGYVSDAASATATGNKWINYLLD